MPQSESLLSRTINTLAKSGPHGTPRKQRINGTNLPEFAVVQRALGPSSMAVSSEPDGWFFTGVLVTK